MTLATFRQLPAPTQLYAVLRNGTLLMSRPVGTATGSICLYYYEDGLGGFFVEVSRPGFGQQNTVCDSFATSDLPACYTPAS